MCERGLGVPPLVDAVRITQEWQELIARAGPPRRPGALQPAVAPPCASVYEPEPLADLLVEQPALARALLQQLSEAQRVTQALAYAAWLGEQGIPVRL